MDDQLEYIEELMLASVAGRITEKDQAFLEEMIAASPEVAALWQQHTVIAKHLKRSFRKSLAWANIENHIQITGTAAKKTKVMTYATLLVVAVLVCFGIYFLKNESLPGNTGANEDRLVFSHNGTDYLITTALTRTPVADIHYSTGILTVEATSKSNQPCKIHVPRKMDIQLKMDDGTLVSLNAASDITFPASFTGRSREVILEGEAYFQVAHNPINPYIVHAKDIKIEVKGTHFNVKAYPGETFSTSLTEGSVAVSRNLHNVILSPGQSATLQSDSFRVDTFDSSAVLGWRKGIYIFSNEKLEVIGNVLDRWFGYTFQLSDPSISQIRFNGEMNKHQSLDSFLELFCRSANLSYTYEKRKVILSSKH